MIPCFARQIDFRPQVIVRILQHPDKLELGCGIVQRTIISIDGERFDRQDGRTFGEVDRVYTAADLYRLALQSMSPADFATITHRVIRTQGFADFQPTACFPERSDIRALAGVPEDVNV